MGIIITTDELIFFRGVGQPPTRNQVYLIYSMISGVYPMKPHFFISPIYNHVISQDIPGGYYETWGDILKIPSG